jgi:hypothetical protein
LGLLLLGCAQSPKPPVVIMGPLVDTPQGARSAKPVAKPPVPPQKPVPAADTPDQQQLHSIQQNIRYLQTITPPAPPTTPAIDPNEAH